MDRGAKVFAILLTLSSLAFSQELRACYKAYLFFLPVAETCITYSKNGKTLNSESFVRTINVGKLVKRVYNKGRAQTLLPDMEPKYFYYYQEEGEFKREQEYVFTGKSIKVKEIKYKGLSQEVEKREEKEYKYEGFVDPYTAGLMLYRDSAKFDKGTIKMFYDDKEYWLPFGVISKERVEVPAGVFETRVVEVHPNIETKGLLKPKGRWYLWIDEKTNLPVKMALKFVIGSATVKLEKIEGDTNILKELSR